MYNLSEQQIDYIRADIMARGIAMESLRDGLTDHICCLIEDGLEEDGDFEGFYQKTAGTFYATEMHEIEEETINLLTHKNFYIMKKIMLLSGLASTVLLIFGLLFKFMHWPGAAPCITVGIVSLSFVFLPLVFLLKIKEKRAAKEKAVITIGTVAASIISVGILFKLMHWPGANVICLSSLCIMVFLFLPLYFTNGVSDPDKKVNTMVSSMMIFAGCALMLTLVRSPQASHDMFVANTGNFLRSEQILCYEQRLNPVTLNGNGGEIFSLCDEIKKFLISTETGSEFIDNDFEVRGQLLSETQAQDYLRRSVKMRQNLALLDQKLKQYNNGLIKGQQPIQTKLSLMAFPQKRLTDALTDLVQFQMMVLQNSRVGS